MFFTKGMNLHSLNFITIIFLFSLTLSRVGELLQNFLERLISSFNKCNQLFI